MHQWPDNLSLTHPPDSDRALPMYTSLIFQFHNILIRRDETSRTTLAYIALYYQNVGECYVEIRWKYEV